MGNQVGLWMWLQSLGWLILKVAQPQQCEVTLTSPVKALKIHQHTLHNVNYLKMYKVYDRFTDLSDAEVDLLIHIYKNGKPDSGLHYVNGFLKIH